MPRLHVIAILESMWDWRKQTSDAGLSEAPRFFTINKQNYSGKRLYRLIPDDARLLVTESCRELVSAANKHGTPDPAWLRENLKMLNNSSTGIDLVLICGKVAQKTYSRCGLVLPKTFEMPHPAARAYWNKQVIEDTAVKIKELLYAN